jgi:hypothetical protein
MRKRRTLSDLYRFPGCKPKRTVHGIFGDSHARVVTLDRQGKKLYVALAALFVVHSMTARPAWYATSPAAAREYISNWISGVSSVGGAVR